MSDGAPMMYHGSGYGGAPPVFMVAGQGERRPGALEYLQYVGAAPAPASPRRPPSPRRAQHPRHRDATAFGYESDDSSLSSNASGSNKSSDKGKCCLEPS